jgi:hypothetical protein
MKTDELISMLSTNVEPIDRSMIARTVGIAVVAAAAAAVMLILGGLGLRADLSTGRAFLFLALKFAFAIAVVGIASVYLARLARPGGERRISLLAIAAPFIAIGFLAATSLGLAPIERWNRMIAGDDWLECLLSIPVIAIVPFAIIIFAVRRTAPTDLVRTGAFAGLMAGSVSALAYALHCSDDSLPFVAVWYAGTIILCTLAGAALGPRLLRW